MERDNQNENTAVIEVLLFRLITMLKSLLRRLDLEIVGKFQQSIPVCDCILSGQGFIKCNHMVLYVEECKCQMLSMIER